jgi:hypothetical protein
MVTAALLCPAAVVGVCVVFVRSCADATAEHASAVATIHSVLISNLHLQTLLMEMQFIRLRKSAQRTGSRPPRYSTRAANDVNHN